MEGRLILIMGDQLSEELAVLRGADPARDVIMMAEVAEEATPVPHHPQKIALVFAAMRKFAARLRDRGFAVLYTRLDDPDSAGSLPGEVLRRMAETGLSPVAVWPGDWRLREALEPLPIAWHEDDRFLCSAKAFAAWAEGRKALRMEWFYREMRRKTGLLMEGDAPCGGQWNFDPDNRKAAEPDLLRATPLRFAPDAEVEEVLALVERRFAGHFGRLRPFGWPVTRAQALEAMAHFMAASLPRFGPEQDAMLTDTPWMSHAGLSAAMNLGLLSPLEVCQAAEAEYRAGRVGIASAEGFIRQILGWREYVRGIWAWKGKNYLRANALGHEAPLPWAYWGGETRMKCLAQAVGQTRDLAYAHHIQRLMITGNFALLAGVDPEAVHRWYLAVYIDAFEWVEAPNTLGMSQFADGGLLASKPYVSSGAYIDRMSDYCGQCHYRVKEKVGARACPFNLLYWDFLDRHRERFARNPRMAPIYRTWEKMEPAHRARVLAEGAELRARLAAGEAI
jgi:deoxyribodipyrimidine photolyase-related protein